MIPYHCYDNRLIIRSVDNSDRIYLIPLDLKERIQEYRQKYILHMTLVKYACNKLHSKRHSWILLKVWKLIKSSTISLSNFFKPLADILADESESLQTMVIEGQEMYEPINLFMFL